VFERTWLSEMMKAFVQILESIGQDDEGKHYEEKKSTLDIIGGS